MVIFKCRRCELCHGFAVSGRVHLKVIGGVSECGWNGLGLDWMSEIGHAPSGDCKLIINYSAGNCFI